jgi:hypothetical protein
MSFFVFRFRNRRSPKPLAPIDLLVGLVILPAPRPPTGVENDIEAAKRRR